MIILPINIHVAIGLLIYGNNVPFQQPRRVILHPQPGGELPRGLPNGRISLGQGSPNQDPPKGPPPDPPIGFYKWLTPNPRMFMPPWYAPVVV